MADDHTPEALADLPPSSKFLYKTLAEEGSMTLKGLTEETLLSSRTARYGLDQLADAGLIESAPALHDGRQTCYSLSSEGDAGTDDGGDSVLVEPAWLHERLPAVREDDPDLCVIEADDEYDRWHVPGAVQLDVLSELVDVESCGIADRRCFERRVGEVGITTESTVVIYSTVSNQYAAYLYWLFKYYHHADVRLLDGGKRQWADGDFPRSTEPATPTSRQYEAHRPNERIRAYRRDVEAAVASDVTVVDVRSAPEYEGRVRQPPNEDLPEARVSGRVPGSVNLTWSAVVDDDGRFLDRSTLREQFHERGVDPDDELIVYCHVGERSSLVWYVLSELLGYDEVANYDGSWIEWGSSVGVPISSGTDDR